MTKPKSALLAATLALATLAWSSHRAAPQAAPLDCKQQLDHTRRLVEDYWAFTVFKPGAYDLDATLAALGRDAEEATTADTCADLLDRLLASLRDGHANLIYFPGRTPRSQPVGVTLRQFSKGLVRGDRRAPDTPVYVVGVEDSAALKAGVVVGARVLAIDGRPIEEVLEHVWQRTSASTAWGRIHWTDRSLLRGPAGSPARLELQLPGGETREATLPRPAGDDGDSAEERNPVEWRTLEDGYVLLRIRTFSSRAVTRALDKALKEIGEAPGMVVDLRGNGGGRVDVLEEVVARFFRKKVVVARLLIREPGSGYINKDIDPIVSAGRKSAYSGPLVLLLDAGCFSACDLFANALDEAGRAYLVGETPTGGGSASPLGFLNLPQWEGVRVRLSFFVATRKDGSHIEGNGVVPHARVRHTLEDYVAGRDPLLERAVSALRAGEVPVTGGS